MGTSQHTDFDFPVEDFLRGKSEGYNLSDKAIMSILFKRGVGYGAPVAALPFKVLELCEADAYMICANLPSVSSSVEDADAGWKHKEGGSQKNSADASRLINMANSIYQKYGENTAKSSFRLRPLGMRVWRR